MRAMKAAILPVCLAFFACLPAVKNGPSPGGYYLKGTGDRRPVIAELWKFLGRAQTAEERFSVVREIANEYGRFNDNSRIINFLGERLEDRPDDPYAGYYMLRIADCYIAEGAPAIAALYFDMAVRTRRDLIVRGSSIHLACLKQLVNLVEDPARKAWYYEQLIARFPEKIDIGAAYFMLGQAYEKLGLRRETLEAYSNLMPYYGTIIPGFPDAYSYAKQMVDLNHILRTLGTERARLDRTFESLPALISAIKGALNEGDAYRLWGYRARVNFFARSWTQIGGDDDITDFNLSFLSTSSKIGYADELSEGSGPNDAYLKTWGWTKFTPTWYFYFRKIYFPMDPQINGRWEWAGVYYGERF